MRQVYSLLDQVTRRLLIDALLVAVISSDTHAQVLTTTLGLTAGLLAALFALLTMLCFPRTVFSS